MNNVQWRDKAACLGLDANLFSLIERQERKPGQPSLTIDRVKDALSVCHRCPVQRECRTFALSSEDYAMVGVWGGEYVDLDTANQRLRDAKARAIGTADAA